MSGRRTPGRSSRSWQTWALVGFLIACFLLAAWVDGHTDPRLLP